MFGNEKPIIMNMITVIPGFKIRKKSDVDVFINKVICTGEYSVSEEENGVGTQVLFWKGKDGNMSVDVRKGNLRNISNPSIEIANTKNKSYKMSVEDAIWKYRRIINHKLLSKE